MRTVKIVCMIVLLLCCASTVNYTEAVIVNKDSVPPGNHVLHNQGAAPTAFAPFSSTYDLNKIVMREQEVIVVGELIVECRSGAPNRGTFRALPPTPSFVIIGPDQCMCPNFDRARIILAPKRGDAGTYFVQLLAATCDGLAEPHGFTVKVKKAVD